MARLLVLAACVGAVVACTSSCSTCVEYGGGSGCISNGCCANAGSDCTSCLTYGGGAGCLDRCQQTLGSCADMDAMLQHAYQDSAGNSPDGYCYRHVSDYINDIGYGGLATFDAVVPWQYWAEARMFAEYMNMNGNAARLGLTNIQDYPDIQNNPYNAPAGSIVVVRAGTPGTRHPTAGDIAVKGDGAIFYNGGEMGYRGSSNFPPSNTFVLGIYVPTSCISTSSASSVSSTTSSSSTSSSSSCTVTTTTSVNVRSSPWVSGSTWLGVASTGTSFTRVGSTQHGSSSKFYKILTSQWGTAYISVNYVTVSCSSSSSSVCWSVTANSLNMRATANGQWLAALPSGTIVDQESSATSWAAGYKWVNIKRRGCSCSSGTCCGWVADSFLQQLSDCSTSSSGGSSGGCSGNPSTINRGPGGSAILWRPRTASFSAQQSYYNNAWNTLQVRSDRMSTLAGALTTAMNNKARYEAVVAGTNVPWTFVAGVHYREASYNFNSHLHNGDPLSSATTRVPAGRGPFSSWEDSARDALFTLKRLDTVSDWSRAGTAWQVEKYNGLGYLYRNKPSPYVFAGFQHYGGGMFVADGTYSSSATDQRVGVMPIIYGLEQLCGTSQLSDKPATVSLEASSKFFSATSPRSYIAAAVALAGTAFVVALAVFYRRLRAALPEEEEAQEMQETMAAPLV